MLSEQQQRIMGYFIEEAKDHLNTIEQGLLSLQSTIEDPDMVSEVFRAAHSVKGGAAMLGLNSIQNTSHRLEDYFKILKECPIRVDQKLETLLLEVFDALKELLEQLQGPFGLTDDKADEVMASVEPVFTQLNEHMNVLVSQCGATPPEDVHLGAVAAVPSKPAVAPKQPVVAEESALLLIFQSDVPVRLREMLQLFKQVDQVVARQQLQDLCQSLSQAGEQFELPTWCELLDMTKRAIACSDNSFRTLAPIVIKDIKQAQELVLAGRSAEITATEALRALVPIQVAEELAELDTFDFLSEDLTFELPEVTEPVTAAQDVFAAADAGAIADTSEPFNLFEDGTFIQSEEFAADFDFGMAAVDSGDGLTDDLGFSSELDFGDEVPDVLDQNGPEVGMAELNSLADLFESEAPDLGINWQEEEILGDSLADLPEPLELETSSDFSDLLFSQDGLDSLGQDDDEDLSEILNNAANMAGQAAQTAPSQDTAAELDFNPFAEEPDLFGEPAAELDALGDFFNELNDERFLGAPESAPEAAADADFDALFDAVDESSASLFDDAAEILDMPGFEPEPELEPSVSSEGVEVLEDFADDSALMDALVGESAATEYQEEAQPISWLDALDSEEGLDALTPAPAMWTDRDEDVTADLWDDEAAPSIEAGQPENLPGLEPFEGVSALDDLNLDELDLDAALDQAEATPEISSDASLTSSFDLPDDFESMLDEELPDLETEPTVALNLDEGFGDLDFADLTAEPEEPAVLNLDESLGELDELDFGTFAAEPEEPVALNLDGDLGELDELDFGAPTVEGEEPVALDLDGGLDALDELDFETPSSEAESSAALNLDEAFGDLDFGMLAAEPEQALEPESSAALNLDEAFGDLDFGMLAAEPEQVSEPEAIAPESDDLLDLDALLVDAEDPLISDAGLSERSVGLEDLSALDALLDEEATDEVTSDLSNLFGDEELNFAEADEASLGEDFSDFDAFLGGDSLGFAEGDESLTAAGASDFDDLDALLNETPAAETSSVAATDTSATGLDDLGLDDFADLEALLGEETSPPASATPSLPVVEDDFADLEALLGDAPMPPTAPPTSPPITAPVVDEFEDLEKLLEDADQTMGGSPTVRGNRSPALSANRRNNRRSPGVLSDQTMRVSIKNLDNLNNLVGELVVNRNSLEQAEERLRQFLDNLLYQVQQLSDVGQRMRDLYERSLLESSLLSSRKSYHMSTHAHNFAAAQSNHATGVSFDALEMDRFTGFHTLSQEMIELIVRVRESASDIDFVVDETDQITRNFRQITTQLQESLNRSRMVPFAQTADRLPRGVRDNSLKYGKQAELVIEGRDTLIDKMIVEQLYDPMTHLVNNAIAHGIETPEERAAAGKPPSGRIVVRAFHQGNQTVISVSDDGAGIDPDKVKAKAVSKGLITAQEAREMTRLDTYDLLFHHGFSTVDQVDDLRGRGVGLDVVRRNLNEIRGVINIDSTIGRGTNFVIRLPLTLSISKALCCISNRARIAFPMDGVEDMLDIPKERIQTNEDDQPCIQWRDQLLPFQPLSDLLKFNRSLGRGSVYGGNQEEDIISVVVLRSNAGSYLALQVDQVLGEQEIVIKQLEGPVPKPVGIAGATVLGDGRIMPIADVLELIDLSMGRIRREAGSSLWDKGEDQVPVEPADVKTEPTVLIVDDSITVRELLSMTFAKIGYRVEQARDGQEAWEKLRSGLPCDLVFCDIEMPRMDGLELLSRLQKDPHLTSIPIAMLTSRGADRHRQMAIQLGAKGYFTKPYLEEVLLDAAQRMLKGEVLVTGA